MDYKIIKSSQHVRVCLASHENNDETRIFCGPETFNGLKIAPVPINTKIAMLNSSSTVS